MGIWQNLVEPGAIAATFTAGTLINRNKRASLFRAPCVESPLLRDERGEQKSDDMRSTIQTRVLAYFPFLLEIWYWLLTYWIYLGLRALSARLIAGHKPIFDVAERHAHQILALEHALHVDMELFVQRIVLERTPWLMPLLARVYYSHIVVGVLFLVYSYTVYPRDKFQSIRRALALENIIAFTLLSLWRCAPPRLLPEEDGFIDVLHGSRSGSAWTQNKFQLTIAAMPSLHFGNSVLIALCLWRFSPHWYIRAVAPMWPVMMGLTIVVTANHFLLDALVGAGVTLAAYRFNAAMLCLLPVERALFRLLRIEKPVYQG